MTVIDYRNDTDSSFGVKIVEGGLWLSGGAFVVRLIGLATVVVILSTLSVREYGIYKLVLAAFGFLASFFIGGFDPLIVNDLARERGEGRFGRVKRLFVEYSSIKIVVGVAFFLLTFFGSSFVGRWYESEVIPFLRTISFLFLLVAFERPLNLLFNVNLKFRLMSLFTVVEEAAKLVLILILVVWAKRGVEGLVIAYVASTAVALLIFMPYGLRMAYSLLKHQASKESVLWFLARAHGKWGIASRYVVEAQKSVSPWLVQVFVGPEAVGLYSLAEGLYGQITSLVPISNLLTPLIPRELGNKERVRNVLLYGIKYGTVAFGIIAVASFFVMPVLVQWAFPHYVPSMPLFRVMAIAFLTTAAAGVVNTILFAYREQKILFFLILVRLLVLMVSSSLLLMWLGVIGMAIAFVLTAIFFVWIRYYSMKRAAPEICVPLGEFFRFTKEDRRFIRTAWNVLLSRVSRLFIPR
ncbi:MAG: hypothetical protein A3C07_02850 [Candidatus Sungbacteria bacterium RIFCSPHIGHO2_02_FULL_47_11]|uniref:Polysaccharide biosynthesis protein C-terminal domain-containing protein n=1 Tax=Candidatus Sungbacteria bacterium RIFCSPHIGHO2_02_FULL_47_11 TaxID=1802270 RepID=A0A1G2KKI5_9BACT|nr:MAG: hypothetical protein A3C07_02850 [Candidatus Sungbacteria bacterium RIFCSPHIGHO2_02_FULL_47_11]